jgi:hypothetical protein
MSRTTTAKYRFSGFLSVIIGQLAVLAILLCFCAQSGFAQLYINITPSDVGGGAPYNGYVLGNIGMDYIYDPSNPAYLDIWRL